MTIEVKGVHKWYGQKEGRTEVLKGADCQIQDGEICVLLGPSGSGKSTLLNIVGGLETADAGQVVVNGTAVHQLNEKQLTEYRRDLLGFVFQFYNLVPDLTVQENVEVCGWMAQDPLDLEELLKTLGLWEHRHKFPEQLSGGQQQRCAIGRALIKNPKILLCDEPTGALDYEMSKQVLKLLEEINRKYGTTVVIVTHNQALGDMAHRVLKVHDGRLEQLASRAEPVPAERLEW